MHNSYFVSSNTFLSRSAVVLLMLGIGQVQNGVLYICV